MPLLDAARFRGFFLTAGVGFTGGIRLWVLYLCVLVLWLVLPPIREVLLETLLLV